MAIITLNNNSLSNISSLPAGVGGKVLQVVTATDETERNITSASYVTGSNTLSVNITPSSTSSKIFIISTFSGGNTSVNNISFYTIFRDSTNLGNAGNGMAIVRADSNGLMGIIPVTVSVLDSPNTTSSITYQIYAKADFGTTGRINNAGSIKGSITAFEVSA